MELIEVNTPLVSQFQQEEETRKAKLKTKEGQEADEQERDEVDEKEVKSCAEIVSSWSMKCLELFFVFADEGSRHEGAQKEADTGTKERTSGGDEAVHVWRSGGH